MSDEAIKVDNLSKKYIIGHQKHDRYQNLRDQFTIGAKRFGKHLLHPLKTSKNKPIGGGNESEEFWALKDVSFKVNQGDRIGIIGRNGAGKSTLLKILSRITEPTNGRVQIKGRLSSLLEVGTGFHPELTGRENIYLNGAILGMQRREINKKFDEIVDFSEVERFLDTPVKRYSSGMYIRLAFAVAAHLEPEILLVDEVLAVGDAVFQKKCLGKMRNVSREGRTILFVSHKMDTIRRLCNAAILISNGELINIGATEEVVGQYLAGKQLRSVLDDRGPAPEKGMHLRAVKLLDDNSRPKDDFTRNESAYIEVTYDINIPLKGVHVVCHFVDNEDRIIVSSGDCDVNRQLYSERSPGTYKAKLNIPTDILNEGEYFLIFSFGVPYGRIYDRMNDVVSFSISDSRKESGPSYLQRRPGFILQDLLWHTEKII